MAASPFPFTPNMPFINFDNDTSDESSEEEDLTPQFNLNLDDDSEEEDTDERDTDESDEDIDFPTKFPRQPKPFPTAQVPKPFPIGQAPTLTPFPAFQVPKPVPFPIAAVPIQPQIQPPKIQLNIMPTVTMPVATIPAATIPTIPMATMPTMPVATIPTIPMATLPIMPVAAVPTIPQLTGLGVAMPAIPGRPTAKAVDVETIMAKMPGINLTGMVQGQVDANINDMLKQGDKESPEDFEARRRLTLKLASIPNYKLNNATAVTAGFIMMEKAKTGITYDPDVEAAILYLTTLIQ